MTSLRTSQFLLRRGYLGLHRSAAVSGRNSCADVLSNTSLNLAVASTRPLRPAAQRAFSQTAIPQKKKNKHASPDESSSSSGGDGSKPKSTAPSGPDPFSFDDIEPLLDRVEKRAVSRLPELRTVGRFNPDTINKLQVRDKKTGAMAALAELAVVVPTKGRTVEIRLHSADSKKAVMSAIQASADFNQQPQPDEDNELALTLKLEPESGDELARRVKEACHEWREGVRSVVRKRRDQLQTWKKDKVIVPDDFRRLEKELMKLHDARIKEVDAKEKELTNAIQKQGAF